MSDINYLVSLLNYIGEITTTTTTATTTIIIIIIIIDSSIYSFVVFQTESNPTQIHFHLFTEGREVFFR